MRSQNVMVKWATTSTLAQVSPDVLGNVQVHLGTVCNYNPNEMKIDRTECSASVTDSGPVLAQRWASVFFRSRHQPV